MKSVAVMEGVALVDAQAATNANESNTLAHINTLLLDILIHPPFILLERIQERKYPLCQRPPPVLGKGIYIE